VHIFYTPYLSHPSFTLDEQESKHAVKVLRLQVQDTIQLIDGKGGLFLAQLIENHPKRCKVLILDKIEQPKRSYSIHIGIAPTKNMERLEFFVEKATEIGIDRITPIHCAHSERKIVKQDRLFKIAIAAAKQSIKGCIPQIDELTSFDVLLETTKNQQTFIAHCEKDEKEPLKRIYMPPGNALILIGPEGDFSTKEIALAKSKGCIPVSLGTERLRTETAGIVACHTINFLNL
jgi:16S rRNA (uracil1498-N3)-methyltransferase